MSHEVALSRRALAKHSMTSALSVPCTHHAHSSCASVCRQGICCYVILKAGVEESLALALEMKGQVGVVHSSSRPLSPSPTRPACVLISLSASRLSFQVRKVIGPFATPDYVILTPVSPKPPLVDHAVPNITTQIRDCVWLVKNSRSARVCVCVRAANVCAGLAQNPQRQNHASDSAQGYLPRGTWAQGVPA